MGSKFPRDGNWTLGKKNRVLTTRPPLDTKVKVAQTCPTLCSPKDYTVYGILQARILESVAIPFSRGSSQPRHPALQADSLPSEPPGKTQHMISVQNLTLSLPTTLQERDRACVWEELGLPLSFCNFSVKERNKRERRRRNNYILANTLFFNNHRGISLIEILLQ